MSDEDLPLPPESGTGFFPDTARNDVPASPGEGDEGASSASSADGEGAPYRVLARKYRPRTFDDLIGQESLVRILRRAFAVGRVAHAFMLTGVRGVGKTTTARIIARALNCTGVDGKGGPTADPCGVCPNCRAILADRHPDVLEMDAASRTGVDDVREIIEAARFRPMQARMKVFVIDEVHMLSRNAFNALLKTLEEPPAQVTFIFATTELRKVPVTVLSRCQRFDLQRVPQAMLTSHFAHIAGKEGAKLEDGALALIARAADGSVRDGLSLLDQAIAQGASDTASVADMLGLADRGMVFDLLEAALHGQVARVLEIAGQAHARGADPGVLLTDLMDVLHLLSRIKALPALRDGVELPEMERVRGGAIVDHVGVSVLGRAWQLLLKGLAEVEGAPDRQQAAEMVLIRLCHASLLPTPDRLIRQLQGGAADPAGGAGQGKVPASDGPATSSPSSSQTASSGASSPGTGRRDTRTRGGGPFAGQEDGQESGPATGGSGREAASARPVRSGPGQAPASPPHEQPASRQSAGRYETGGKATGGNGPERAAVQQGSTMLKPQDMPAPGAAPSQGLRLATENGTPVARLQEAVPPPARDVVEEGEEPSARKETGGGEVPSIPPMPRSWREMVALVRQQREAHLHGVLRHLGHPVEFAPPRLVLRIADEDQARKRQGFRSLTALLDRLYPGRWQVVPSEEEGGPTLDEQGAEIIALHQDKARQHPLVQAILHRFPKAEIGEVRDHGLDDYGLPPEEPIVSLGEDVPPDFEFAPPDAEYSDEDDFY